MAEPPVSVSGDALRAALVRLGERTLTLVRIVLAGGSALILGGTLRRTTRDGDVVAHRGDWSQLEPIITEIGHELGLAERWLNTDAEQWANVLPEDYEERCVPFGSFGQLDVVLLHRKDLILRKLMALRDQDMQDLEAMEVTQEELAFATAHFVRIASRHPARVVRARLFLQGPGVRPLDAGSSAPVGARHLKHRPPQS